MLVRTPSCVRPYIVWDLFVFKTSLRYRILEHLVVFSSKLDKEFVVVALEHLIRKNPSSLLLQLLLRERIDFGDLVENGMGVLGPDLNQHQTRYNLRQKYMTNKSIPGSLVT